MKKRRKKRNPTERFWEYVHPEPNSGCWLWIGTTSPGGYGHFKINGREVLVHRFAYETYRVPILTGLQIDHLCRTRCCVNPDHMEAVTNKENILRGISPIAQNGQKVFCKRGHVFSGPDSYLSSTTGERICRQCKQICASERLQRADDLRLLKTLCKRGHEVYGENLAINAQGTRGCRICNNLRARLSYYRQKQRKKEATV